MSSSLHLHQCHVCLVRLSWMISEIGGKWPYSCCFMEYCFQDLFNIARSNLVQFLSSFFSMRLVSVHVVHPYSRINITAAWYKSQFILSDWSDLHMIDSLSIAVEAFAWSILTSLTVDKTLMMMYGNMSNLREPPFKVEMSPSRLKHIYFILFAFTWRPMLPAACSRLCRWNSACICKRYNVICIICICYSFCRISFPSCPFLV